MRAILTSALLLLCTSAYADSCWSSNTRLDYWCAAEAYDAKGLYQLAGTMRCGILEVRKHFVTREECVAANMRPPPPPPPILVCEKEEHEEVEVEVHNNLVEKLETVARKQQEDEQNRKMYAQQTLTELMEMEQ